MSFGRIAVPGTPSYAEFLRWAGSRGPDAKLAESVGGILADVRSRGEEAALEQARRTVPNLSSLYVDEDELRKAEVPSAQFQAMRLAIDRVQRFHERQVEALTKGMTRASVGWQWRMPASGSPSPGTGFLGQRILPMRRVGACVGARSAGAVVACAVPAKVAGVEECILAASPQSSGAMSPALLVAARETGARTVLRLGGAAAVALLASGTDRFGPVERVFGSDGPEAAEAARQLWGGAREEGFCVLMDETGSASAAARELARAALGSRGPLVLVATSQGRAEAVHAEFERDLAGFSDSDERSRFSEVLENLWSVLAAEEPDACEIVDLVAPARLTILTKDPDRTMLRIRSSALVALGEGTPHGVLEFAAGPAPALSVLDFWHVQTAARLSASDLKFLEPSVEALTGTAL